MRTLLWIAIAWLGCAAAPPLAADADPPGATPAEREARWTAGLRGALAVPGLRGASLSALVVERNTGRELFARQPDLALIPASSEKILTALAVLDAYGPTHRFSTRVSAVAPLDAAGNVADLYVQGGGDPTLTSEQWWRLAADLRALGLTGVTGDLIVDDALFDAERWHPSWKPLTARAYHPPVGALAANYGAFRVVVTPGPAVGAAARVRLDPPLTYFQLESRVTTAPFGKPSQLRVERLGTNGAGSGAVDRIAVSGRISIGAEPAEYWRSVTHPALYAGSVLRMQLEGLGVPVAGRVRVGRAPPAHGFELAFEGEPLHRVLNLFLKYSNNFIAESLVKSLAIPGGVEPAPATGSWAEGGAELRRRLDELALPTAGTQQVDGSGLSRKNRATGRLLVAALRAADARFALGPELLASLPIAGRDGTLRKRAAGARGLVRAKTGTLDGVTALAGHAQTRGGRDLVFALLVNGDPARDGAFVAAVDAFATALVNDD